MLGNEDFIHNETVYRMNKQFAATHNVEYIIWTDAHHLHHTDFGFINGNFLGIVKNSVQSREQMELNLEAIDSFLKG